MCRTSITRSIAAVTTVHNECDLLPRQIRALLSQTYPLQEIIVVDNASKDGTAKMLSEQYPRITVLKMEQNLGAAGAWAKALSFAAIERRHDWVWTFDADSIPAPESLAALLSAFQWVNGERDQIGIVAPLPVHRETGTYYPPLFWNDGFVRPGAKQMLEPLWFADLVIASGSLIRREVVERIGLPRADFFMDFFDFEYSLRARMHGFKIAVVSSAELAHEIGNARRVWLPGGHRLWSSYAPWREYYVSRNLAYAAWHLYPNWRTKKFALRHLLRRFGATLLFSRNKPACIHKMIQGFRDGRAAKLGIRFTPDK